MKQNTAQTVGLLTKHKKAPLIAPVFLSELGWELVLTENYDTDQLGTFAGEIERWLSPVECAETKAREAASLLQCDIALGSEGSFGDGPYGPIVPWHSEILVCISVQDQWRVTGIAQGPSCHQHMVCRGIDQATSFYQQLPSGQGVIVYPEEGAHLIVFKGISNLSELKKAFAQCDTKSPSNSVIVEYDLRAHMCPQRQEMIVEAAKDLAKRLKLLCPECHTPGFYADKLEPGLPCRWCETPTSQILQRSAICQICDYEQTEVAEESHTDPRYCPQCNP